MAAPTEHTSDEQLWARSMTGDGEAFGVLFDRHRDRVFRHACRLSGDRTTAEDAVATTFLELWRRRADVRLVGGSILPWLLVTTTNVARNAARTTRRYRDLLARLPHEPHGPDVADVLDDSGVLGVDPSLRAALRTLRRIDLQLFALVALEGYPLGDAATLLGLTSSAAKSRLYRARAQLREQLGDRPQSDEFLTAGGPR